MDSDFDVDESTWHAEVEGEEQQLEEKKKKKQWIKPSKPKVWKIITVLVWWERECV